jgi:cytochrome c peroxidase
MPATSKPFPPAKSEGMKPLKLTKQESADLVAFMKAHTGECKSLEELLPTLPSGPAGDAPDPRAALTPPSQKVAGIFHPIESR